MMLRGKWRIVERDEVRADGWVELQPNGSLAGEVRFHGGDEITFITKPWTISSTAC